MRRILPVGLIAALAAPGVVWGEGWARDENFIVLAADFSVGQAVLDQANRFRSQLAREWLGEELPPRVGRAIITVTLSETVDRGLTWPIDSPGRRYHDVWLTGSEALVTGPTLAHEITHVVLATRFPGMLPAWIDEGAASVQDDPKRVAIRQRILDRYVRSGSWPDLRALFDREQIPADDQSAYAVAASVTQYLLGRADRATLLAFGLAGRKEGWDAALKEHYGLERVEALQAAWQAWVGRGGAVTASSGPGRPVRVAQSAGPKAGLSLAPQRISRPAPTPKAGPKRSGAAAAPQPVPAPGGQWRSSARSPAG